MATQRVLIVGGGIAGLSLNLALRAGPCHVEMVERNAGGDRLGAGLAVQPNAMRALKLLGIGSAVEQAGTVIEHFQYRDQHGVLLCDIELNQLWGDVGPFVGITRQALHNALRPGPGSCRVATVRAVTQDGSQVSVTFDDGTSAAYDLVVGADGINSTVRRCITDLPGPAYVGQMVWRSVAPIRPDELDGLDGVQFWLGPDRFFGLCPAGDGLTYGFGNLTCPPSQEPVGGRKRRLLERFTGFGAPVQHYLSAVQDDNDIHCAPVQWLPDMAWQDGRVVLIGDAAHAMSPMMGQGGCMAIEDALVLADELHRDPDITAALTAFAARRRARVQQVREHSHTLGELIRRPAHLRDQALREHGVTAFHDRYRPLTTPP